METLYYSRMQSPAGSLVIGVSEDALVLLEFDRGIRQRVAGKLVQWEESEPHTRKVRRQLEEYFAGKRKDFDLKLDLRGSEFSKSCWKELLRIPYGETRSYGDIARAVGRPTSFRAVGQANHNNPIAIIVPCHRVLASDKTLNGYGGGLSLKALLLKLEGASFREETADPADDRQMALMAQ